MKRWTYYITFITHLTCIERGSLYMPNVQVLMVQSTISVQSIGVVHTVVLEHWI